MATDNRDVVRINLTSEQRETVKAATNRDADAIELTVEELEQRIAPSVVGPTDATGGGFRLALNHNETFLVDL